MNPAMFRAMALRGGLGPRPVMPQQPQQMPLQNPGAMNQQMQLPTQQMPRPTAPLNNFMQSGMQGFGMGNRGAY